jgi:AcrR family transcriptional regulator
MQLPLRDYSAFERVEEAKRERIIQIALEEFAANDYAQVSTNTIVERAQISKGLLFHYFGDKAGLFWYLQARVIGRMTAAAASTTTLTDGDFFDVLWRVSEAKMDTARRFPLETRFYVRTMIDRTQPPDIRSTIEAQIAWAYSLMDVIIEQLDPALLREGLDPDKACRVAKLVCEGLANEVIAEMTPDVGTDYWQEKSAYVTSYCNFLRQLLYR